ncbi:MAG: hypothetical protein IIV58_04770 [Alistipes sp.]|nr:hypothetical protein [Alistipes sp.]
MNLTNKDFIELIERDYVRKVEQLHRHLLSIWTRFNFFITFEGLIISANFISDNKTFTKDLSIWVRILGLLTAVIWYCFSANDRYLVKIYRNHVDEAHKILCNLIEKYANMHLSIDFDMSVESATPVKSNFLGWRYKKIGLTDYATMVPLLMILFWGTYIISKIITC